MNEADHFRDYRGSGEAGDGRIGRREQQISGKHGHIRAASGEDRGRSPAKHRAIVQIIVDQRSIVEELRRCSDDDRITVRQAQSYPGIEPKSGSHPMTAGGQVLQSGLNGIERFEGGRSRVRYQLLH